MSVRLECTRWGLMWRSFNQIECLTLALMFDDGLPLLFKTRAEARAFANKEYGYIRERKDLQTEPHGWKVPLPIRVRIEGLPS